jgi:hypothetical protein
MYPLFLIVTLILIHIVFLFIMFLVYFKYMFSVTLLSFEFIYEFIECSIQYSSEFYLWDRAEAQVGQQSIVILSFIYMISNI